MAGKTIVHGPGLPNLGNSVILWQGPTHCPGDLLCQEMNPNVARQMEVCFV